MTEPVAGHAFICYVREDAEHADTLTALLADAGIPVWRDTENLWPGENWRDRIREAITNGAFAFIPIFTSTSVAKGVSGQNEELYLAADEMRRRQPNASWIMPVRFDDCSVPKLTLGGGRMLDDIQRADLFGPNAERETDRLVTAIRRIVEVPAENAPERKAGAPEVVVDAANDNRVLRELKESLRDPTGDIRLHDLVVPIADATYDGLVDDERYPVNGTPGVDDLVGQVDRYWQDLDGLLDIVVTAGAWSRGEHNRTWTDVVQRVARSCTERRSGNVARLSVRWFPLVALVYAGGLAAVHRENFAFVRSVVVDAEVRVTEGFVPVGAKASPWQPFSEWDIPVQVLALQASGENVDDDVVNALQAGRRGKRYTPASDVLHDRLRPRLRPFIPDDEQYSATFDRLEVLLAAVVADLRAEATPPEGERWSGPYIGSPFTGRFTWRDRYAADDQRVEQRMLAEVQRHGDRWPPLAGGLFGGSVDRAERALQSFVSVADNARAHRM